MNIYQQTNILLLDISFLITCSKHHAQIDINSNTAAMKLLDLVQFYSNVD